MLFALPLRCVRVWLGVFGSLKVCVRFGLVCWCDLVCVVELCVICQ